MISPDYVRRLARYNAWQNANLYAAAATLTDAQRKQATGAFFGSIHATFNHLLWADRMWMHRLAGWPKPDAPSIQAALSTIDAFDDLRAARVALDSAMEHWAASLGPADLDGDLSWYSGALKRDFYKLKWEVLVHVFNHQTHHRGQIHCLLTQFGARPDDTDFAFME